MSRRLLVSIGIVFGGLVLVSAITSAAESVVVNVPFSFTVRDATLPAGRYEVRVMGNEQEQIEVQSLTNEQRAVTGVITREAETGIKEPEVVFDRADGMCYLAEIREPGIDGYVVHITKGAHTHERIPAEAKATPARHDKS